MRRKNILVTLLLCSTLSAFGQKVTLDCQDQALKNVFKDITKQTGLSFSYSPRFVKLDRKISVSALNTELSSVLDRILKGTGIGYEIGEKEIILFSSPDKRTEQEKPVRQNVVKEVSGTVKDVNGETIIGANVIVKGTANGAITDVDGKFRLSGISDKDIIEISFIGYRKEEFHVGNNDILEITLVDDAKLLNEVVVIGYGSTTVKSSTGSISSVKSDDISKMTSSNFASSLSGKATGVQIIQPTGQPGAAPEIRVRGIGTLTAGSYPLIVVDGFPLSEGSDINSINPNSIASIEVLKDAASTAIYGSRGANGIIMITTKSGKVGKPNVNLSMSYGYQQRTDKVDLVNAYDFAQFMKEARNTGYVNKDPNNRSENDTNAQRLAKGASKRELIPDYIVPYLNGESGLTDTDWYDEIFRTARIQDYNLTVSGGGEKTSYSFSGGYMQQDGILIGTDFEKYSANANLRFIPTKNITLGVSLSPSYIKTNKTQSRNTWGSTLPALASISYPFFSPYNEDGTLAISKQIEANIETDGALCENPVAWAKMIKNEDNVARMFGNVYAEVSLFSIAKYKVNIGADYESERSDYFKPSTIGQYRSAAPAPAEAIENSYDKWNYLIENTLTVNKDFDNRKHHLQFLLGQSYQKESFNQTNILASGFTDNSIENIAGGSNFKITPSQYEWAMISYFSRLNYNLLDRYMLNASVRWDGSSRFGKNSKWGFFPAISAAWLLSNESFLNGNDAIQYAKLRFSWGTSGNNQIPNYGALAVMKKENYITDGALASGALISTSPNPDLSWEKNNTFNLGLDFVLYDYLGLSLDLYSATTNDLLLEVPVPQQSGYSSSLQNIGKIRNQGIEFRAYTAKDVRFGDFSWNSSINMSMNKDKVLALASGQTQIINDCNITQVGHSIGELYGYDVIGVYKSQEDLDKYPHMPGTQIGDYIIKDLTGEETISTADKKSFGSPAPKVILGFSNTFKYKDFELSIDLYSELGKKKFNSTKESLQRGEGFMMITQDYFDNRYHPVNNPDGTLATPNMANYSNTRKQCQYSSLYFDDASYVSLRNLKFAYNIPSSFLSKVGISSAQVYFLGNNLLTLTSYKGFSVEAERYSNILQQGQEHYAYPSARTMSLGINVNF